MKLHWFSLAFTGQDAPLEAVFLADYFRRNLRMIRLAFLAGVLTCGLYGCLDMFYLPGMRDQLWLIRYGVICPAIALGWLFTWTPWVERHWQLMSGLAILISGLGVVAMIRTANTPLLHTYYAGVNIVLIFGYVVSRMRFLTASVVGLVIVGAYLVGAAGDPALPLPVRIGNSSFCIGTNLLCMLANYYLEHHARRTFYYHHLLGLEKDRVQLSHRELATKVTELEQEKEKVRVLTGLIPVCAHCKRVRDEAGGWRSFETYIRERSMADFSHGICPDCSRTHFQV